MVQKIANVTNADAYVNGTDVKGRVSELDLGEIGHAEVEHSALGMIGVIKLPGRPVDAIEGKIGFEWVDEEIERNLGNPTKMHKLQLHSYVDVFDADGLNVDKSHTLVTHINFQTMKVGGRTAKLGEQMASEHDICIQSFMQKVYGAETPIVEYDAFNCIYRINGEDVWPT